MMGIMVPETCWENNKISNKNHLLHLVGILFPHINDDEGQINSKLYAENYNSFYTRKIENKKYNYTV
jgi:hypothetical protein